MHPHHEVRVAAHAEGEKRVLGVGADARVPGVAVVVAIVHVLQLAPQQPAEPHLGRCRRFCEDGHEGAQLVQPRSRGEARQVGVERRGGRDGAEPVVEAELVGVAAHHRPRPQAGVSVATGESLEGVPHQPSECLPTGDVESGPYSHASRLRYNGQGW